MKSKQWPWTLALVVGAIVAVTAWVWLVTTVIPCVTVGCH